MLNIGFAEFVFIGVVALLLIGPKQLPDVARAVAKFINELKQAGQEASSALLSARDEAQGYLQQVVTEATNPPPDQTHSSEETPVNHHDTAASETSAAEAGSSKAAPDSDVAQTQDPTSKT